MVNDDRNLHRLPQLRRRSSSLAAQGRDWARWSGSLGGEERGWGRMASRGRLGPFQWFLYLGGELGVRGFECRGLGSGAVHSGWHHGLRLRVWSAVSAA
jgi:hypothetical protein